MVRAETPAALSAVSRASEFITVASMPMESAVARSIQPAALMRAPRMMLPPPTTTAISKPAFVVAAMSSASAGQGLRVEPVAVRGHQRLARQLHQHAAERLRHVEPLSCR